MAWLVGSRRLQAHTSANLAWIFWRKSSRRLANYRILYPISSVILEFRAQLATFANDVWGAFDRMAPPRSVKRGCDCQWWGDSDVGPNLWKDRHLQGTAHSHRGATADSSDSRIYCFSTIITRVLSPKSRCMQVSAMRSGRLR